MTAEQLRERLSRTLKTYVPPTALPTPLDSGDAESAFDRSERESTR
jgi:hypothetical protein